VSEAERAAFYQAQKDDPAVWGEPEKRPRGRPSQGLKTIVTVRFTAEEAAILRRRAAATGESYSTVIRRALRDGCPESVNQPESK
jgi:hypothetical protein